MKLRDELEIAFGDNLQDDFYDKLHDKLELDELISKTEAMMNIKTDSYGDVTYERKLPNEFSADKLEISLDDLICGDGFTIKFNKDDSNEYIKYNMGEIFGFIRDDYGTYKLNGLSTGTFSIGYVTNEEKNKADLEHRACIPTYETESIDVSNQHDQMLDFAVAIAKNGVEAIKNMDKFINTSYEYQTSQKK